MKIFMETSPSLWDPKAIWRLMPSPLLASQVALTPTFFWDPNATIWRHVSRTCLLKGSPSFQPPSGTIMLAGIWGHVPKLLLAPQVAPTPPSTTLMSPSAPCAFLPHSSVYPSPLLTLTSTSEGFQRDLITLWSPTLSMPEDKEKT